MDAYETRAVFKCIAAGTTAEQVEAMGYRQIAVLAGVVIPANGHSPEDFFYENIRHVVADMLAYYAKRGYLPEESDAELDRLEMIKEQIAELNVQKTGLEAAIAARPPKGHK